MGYITTYLKKHFDPVNADVNDIEIADIDAEKIVTVSDVVEYIKNNQ